MKRKVLCSILAILIILASVPMTAFAADGGKIITDISLTATRDLIQYYDGWYNHEEGTPYFYYKVFDGARPDMFVTYSDGSSENVSYDNFHEHFWSTNVVTLQSVATEFGLGTNTAEIEIFYGDEGEKSIKTSIDFTIIENPVESFSVIANKPLIENVSGSYQDKYDEETRIEQDMMNEVLDEWDLNEDLWDPRYQKSDSPQSVNEDTVREKSRTWNVSISSENSSEISKNLNEIKKVLTVYSE